MCVPCKAGKAEEIWAGGFLLCGFRRPQLPLWGIVSHSPLLEETLSLTLEQRESAAMAAPQPKKIVAPTVSQINAEFVTQVRLGESGVCEG